MRAVLLTFALLGVLPWTSAAARECESTLGRGWPPAVGNDGTAVTTLLDASTRPSCCAGELLQQAALLIEAGEGKENKRDKRWTQIESSLDELQQTLAGTAG
ncbi:hypothetical protein [Xanthomonas arboricola]|uniref:hypothetical protein n=1 Tax=Xanthomonas arboricola TaxID=56448 RepID=UPI000CEF4F1E|nr:hypothetical protein [Xanthomonas arboricola]PPU38704.1 hypothetical protein XaplCFBP3123_17120 [Xanthomonas arboricola pv. populi]